MERLLNCNVILDIELIENITGANQRFEIFIITKNKKKYKIIFDFVWDLRYSIESGYLNRAINFKHEEQFRSSILCIENSKYIEYFDAQTSKTRSVEKLKNYILFDNIDTVIEVLSLEKPVLVEL